MSLAILRRFGVALSLFLVSLTTPVMAEGDPGSYLAARNAMGQNDFDDAARYFTRALARDPAISNFWKMAHWRMSQPVRSSVQ